MGHRRQFSAFVTKDSNCTPTIRHALQFAREFLNAHTFEPRLQVKFAIVVEELVANSLRHGGKTQDLALLLAVSADQDGVRLQLYDDGPPFDPLSVAPVAGPNPVTGGGIGLAIVRAWGEDPCYTRTASGNTLTLILR